MTDINKNFINFYESNQFEVLIKQLFSFSTTKLVQFVLILALNDEREVLNERLKS